MEVSDISDLLISILVRLNILKLFLKLYIHILYTFNRHFSIMTRSFCRWSNGSVVNWLPFQRTWRVTIVLTHLRGSMPSFSGFMNTAHMRGIDIYNLHPQKQTSFQDTTREKHTRPADSLSDSLDLNFLISVSELGLKPRVLCMRGMYSAVELHTILVMAVVLYSDAVPTMCHER